VFVDGTVVNVALPTIRDDLGFGLSGQQWIVDAYLLTLSSLLLIGGSLGDVLGRRKMFTAGLLGFGLTSIICASAPTIEVLIVGRALQGIAGALLVPSTLGLIVATFESDDRGAAIGSWTAWTGIATVIGPLGGGLILATVSWRWIFAINIIPIAIALVLVSRLSDEHDRPIGGRVDLIGASLCAVGLGGTVYALIEQPNFGWGDPRIAVPLAIGLLSLIAFIAFESRASHPMLSLDLFRSRNFSVGNAATLVIYAGLGGALFVLILFLQQVAGYTPLEAGASLLPLTVLMFLLSKRFGALSDRIGPRLFMGGGPILAALGVLLLMRLDQRADYVNEVLPAVIVLGLGLSLTVAPLTATVLGGVAARHASIASGVNNSIARVAGLLAIAAVGALIAAQFSSQIDAKISGGGFGPAARAELEAAKSEPLAGDAPSRPADRVQVQAVLDDASVSAFRLTMGLMGALMACGGLLCAIGIQNPRRIVHAEECPGGSIVGSSKELETAVA
jgi:EmrB/QacA subfamily drug resistance transporter